MVLYQSLFTQPQAHHPFELTETLSRSMDTWPSPVCVPVLPCTFFCFNSNDEWQLVVKYQCCQTDLLLFLEAGLGKLFSSCFSADSFLKPSSLNQPAQQTHPFCTKEQPWISEVQKVAERRQAAKKLFQTVNSNHPLHQLQPSICILLVV